MQATPFSRESRATAAPVPQRADSRDRTVSFLGQFRPGFGSLNYSMLPEGRLDFQTKNWKKQLHCGSRPQGAEKHEDIQLGETTTPDEGIFVSPSNQNKGNLHLAHGEVGDRTGDNIVYDGDVRNTSLRLVSASHCSRPWHGPVTR